MIQDAESVAAEDAVLRVPCNAPAPLVLNGASYCGCQLSKGHEGPHKVEITWQS